MNPHYPDYSTSSTIAKYSDGIWTNVGSLKYSRDNHQAITIEGKTMIIGGDPYPR